MTITAPDGTAIEPGRIRTALHRAADALEQHGRIGWQDNPRAGIDTDEALRIGCGALACDPYRGPLNPDDALLLEAVCLLVVAGYGGYSYAPADADEHLVARLRALADLADPE